MYKIAVIGLGRFGMALARQLAASGAEVIAIDNSRNLIEEIKDEVAVAVKLNSTDETALRSQDVDKADMCVVSIGENFEGALLTTVLVKKLGVPRVICRAQTAFHAEIFKQIGADEVIQPEEQAGRDMARKLASPHIEEYITLAPDYSMIEITAPEQFVGHSLKDLDLRRQFAVNLVAIKRVHTIEQDGEEVQTEDVLSVPRPDDVIETTDRLVVVGSNDALSKMPKE